MRILHWNCNNGIGKKEKIEYFRSFKADIAIIPELKKDHIDALMPESAVWVTNNHTNKTPKGLGILAYNGYRLSEIPRDADLEIYVPLLIEGNDISFHLIAFWNFYSACKQGRFKGVDGIEYAAIEQYSSLFQDPALVIGDLNYGPTFYKDYFIKLSKKLSTYGLTSLYHKHFSLAEDTSHHSTFRSNRGKYHHIDHIFGSESFSRNMESLQVEDFSKVILSDHAPIILDINITAVAKSDKAA